MLGCKQLLKRRPYRREVFLLCCRRVASDRWKKLSQVFCFTQWVPVPSFDCNQPMPDIQMFILLNPCVQTLGTSATAWKPVPQAKKSRLYCAYLGSSSNTLTIFQPRHTPANGTITERSGQAHASFRLPSRTSTDTSLVAQPLPGVPPEL